jgi:glycosyltransferase involved in cell wall biosynthesis
MSPERPRVMLVGPFPPPYGGVSAITEQLAASSLRERWTLIPLNISLAGELRETGSEWKGIKVRKALVLLWRTVVTLWRERPQAGIVQMSGDLSFLRQWLVGLLIRLSGARCIVYFHGSLKKGWRYYPFRSDRKPTLLARVLINCCFGSFHKVIFLSEKLLREFTPLLTIGNRNKSTWVENFVRVGDFIPGNTQGDRKLTVLFVGRLSKVKGFFDLLEVIPEVVQHYPNVVFSVCGTYEHETSLDPVREQIGNLERAGSLVLHGLVAGKAKQRVFAEADILVFPSHVEIFPVAILEGMAQGIPVIATNVGVVDTVIHQPENGILIDPGRTDQLTEAILYLLDHPDDRVNMGGANRKAAEARFDIAVAVQRLSSIVEENV